MAAKTLRTPFEILEDFERRSLAHSTASPARQAEQAQWRGVGFRVGEHRYVANFEEVVEIVPLPPVTPVPGAQAWLLGIGNLRGNLFPVIDLKQFMQGERTVFHEGMRVLVMRQSGGDVALAIDELYGQRGFNDHQAVPTGALAGGRFANFVQRAYRAEDADWGVFSLALLARTPEFRHAALS